MLPPGADRVVVRYGEIGVKSERVRRSMVRQLWTNFRAILDDRDLDGEFERERYRLVVRTDDPDAVCEAAADTFGVVSASPALRTDATLAAIRDALRATARGCYEDGAFAVRANRAGDEGTHPFSSRDVEREGGSAVWEAAEAAGRDPEVDLDDPDVEFFVDCRPDEAFVFTEQRSGPGGLPLGTQRPVVGLVSGGIDSPVACWRLLKRGAPVVPLYVGLGDYGGVDNQARALSTVERLAGYAPNFDLRLRFAPAGDAVAHIAETVEQGRMVVLRRFMFRVAEAVADHHDAVGIVTGEAVGQKSSQTTANLATTSAVTDLPVHRPLLTEDKNDISAAARRIGTYHESTIPAGCDRIAPEHPVTAITTEEIRSRAPSDLDDLARDVADRVDVLGHGTDAPAGRDETA